MYFNLILSCVHFGDHLMDAFHDLQTLPGTRPPLDLPHLLVKPGPQWGGPSG